MGHLHPTIKLSDKYKKEKYKCFLFGEWKKISVIIMPSFMDINYGYSLDNINKDGREFTFINKKSLKNFNVVIYNIRDDKHYNFGKLKKLI